MSVCEAYPHPAASDHGRHPIVSPDRDTPRQRSAQASQRIAALGEMTAGLAHDFRNILAVINSAVNLAERDSGDKERLDAALGAAREGIGRGTALTARLLAFARQRPHEAKPEDLNALLGRLGFFLDYAAGPDIRIKFRLAPELPSCRVDASQFGAAILNLVVNARDAMPNGGEIVISSDRIALAETDDAALDAQSVVVRVIDQGEGMAIEMCDRIFDPYFTTKGETGTGLGLPQVAAFMRSSGGCLNVSSEPGVGTSFDLYFPVSDSPGLVGTSLWRQLDRWMNEGGHESPLPRFGH